MLLFLLMCCFVQDFLKVTGQICDRIPYTNTNTVCPLWLPGKRCTQLDLSREIHPASLLSGPEREAQSGVIVHLVTLGGVRIVNGKNSDLQTDCITNPFTMHAYIYCFLYYTNGTSIYRWI